MNDSAVSFFFLICFIYPFILALMGLHCSAGFSLVAESRGESPVAALWLLTAVTSRVVDHRL